MSNNFFKQLQAWGNKDKQKHVAPAAIIEEPPAPTATATEGECATVIEHTTSISVCFYIEQQKPLDIGQKMQAICEEAYMNGYNWEAFFNYYLPKYAPDLLEGMDTDPEAGMYAAYYDNTPENKARAEKFAALINRLVEEDEEKIYDILHTSAEDIVWD